jgi:hypothetical protein
MAWEFWGVHCVCHGSQSGSTTDKNLPDNLVRGAGFIVLSADADTNSTHSHVDKVNKPLKK